MYNSKPFFKYKKEGFWKTSIILKVGVYWICALEFWYGANP